MRPSLRASGSSSCAEASPDFQDFQIRIRQRLRHGDAMTAPRPARRKPVRAPLPSSRDHARPLAPAPREVVDAPRGYPTAAALFASGGISAQLGATLRALLGPAALMGAVGVAACGPLDAPPKTEPNADIGPTDTKPKPDDAAQPNTTPPDTTPSDTAPPVSDTPSVTLTPLPPQLPPTPPRPPVPHTIDTGHPPRPWTPPIVSGPLPPLPRPPITRGAMVHVEPPRPEPVEPLQLIRPRPDTIPLGGAPMVVQPPPPPVRPAPHAPQAPGRIMVRPDVE